MNSITNVNQSINNSFPTSNETIVPLPHFITLHVGNYCCPIEKQLLENKSPIFKTVLSSNWNKDDNITVDLPVESEPELDTFISYLSDNPNWDSAISQMDLDSIKNCLQLAFYYQLPEDFVQPLLLRLNKLLPNFSLSWENGVALLRTTGKELKEVNTALKESLIVNSSEKEEERVSSFFLETWSQICASDYALEIKNCQKLTARELIGIIEENPCMNRLTIEQPRFDFNAFLDELKTKKILSLKVVNIPKINEKSIAKLLEKLPNLESLSLDSCTNLKQIEAKEIENSSIKKLDFSHCIHLGEASLVALIKRCSSLKEVILDSNSNINSNVFQLLFPDIVVTDNTVSLPPTAWRSKPST